MPYWRRCLLCGVSCTLGSCLLILKWASDCGATVAPQEAALAELDARLDGLMDVVRLSYLIKREGGWGAVTEWGETLSLGPTLRGILSTTA